MIPPFLVPFMPTIASWIVGKLPGNAARLVGKAVGVLQTGISYVEPVVDVLKRVTGLQPGQDISADELAKAEAELDAAYGDFKARAADLRGQA